MLASRPSLSQASGLPCAEHPLNGRLPYEGALGGREGASGAERSVALGAFAEVTAHYFRAASQMTHVPVLEGILRIPMRERSDDGAWVEWVEIDLRAS